MLNNMLIFKMLSNIAILSAIFVIVRSESDCGAVLTKKQFILESPRYPNSYPLNYECSYLIQGQNCPTTYNFQFLDFDLESSVGCTKDRLEIDDQDAICGSKTASKSYFASKGNMNLKFISDQSNSGRGFKILVTRQLCEKDNTFDTDDVEFTGTTTTTARPVYIPRNPVNNHCCSVMYSSKQFTLVSPNFPYTMSSASDCLYQIRKANLDVCRLRMHVEFFWLGNKDQQNCVDGFLEVDGKYICGCKSDLKLVSPFQSDSKFIRFVSRGQEQNSFSGFVIHVIQDECPKRIIPETKGETPQGYMYYNDQINRVAWPISNSNGASIEKLRLVSENTEFIDPANMRQSEDNCAKNNLNSDRRESVRHIYVFAEDPTFELPGNIFPLQPKNKDVEETNYVDTSNSQTVVGDKFDYRYCLSWNRRQYQGLVEQKIPSCGTTRQVQIPSRNCVELGNVRGYFKSPGYPMFYPSNLNLCYRFRKQPGYCSVRITMNDFQIEESPGCQKDYLLFSNGFRYCSNRLAKTISTLDMTGKMYEDVIFVTDPWYCGRGFLGTYEQIACPDMNYPINPRFPQYPPSPPLTPRPPTPLDPKPSRPLTPCQRTIRDRTFVLEVDDRNEPICVFIIQKYFPDVCKLYITFETFDLECYSESLVIDGKMYCGHMSGRTILVDFARNEHVIVYKRLRNRGVVGTRLKLRGNMESCYTEVPAQRLLQSSHAGNASGPHSNDDSKYLLKLAQEYSREICGVISSNRTAPLPKTFCDLIRIQENNVTQCIPLKDNSLFVPLGVHSLELKVVNNMSESQVLEFEEVSCADVI